MPTTKLSAKVLKGDVAAAARLIRQIEDEAPEAAKELEKIYPCTGKASIVGVAGAPGAGKSSLIDALITIHRKRNMTVGVVAVDPTSPFTGGAILGDRIRMQQHNTDKGVFIRSLATRGWKGGLAKATVNAVHVMDAMGKDIIFVEAVGSGQAEVDVAKIADTAILVLTPGMGDEIQMLKAGILEAADILVINKADREGVDNLKRALETMVDMKATAPNEWKPSIVLTEAVYGKGAEQLADEIKKHSEFLVASGELEKRRRIRAELELIWAVEGAVMSHMERLEKKYLEKLVEALAKRQTCPHAAAHKIIERYAKP